MRRISAYLGAALLLAGCATAVGVPLADGVASALVASPPVLPALGATAAYRVINGYSGEAQGEIRYRVEQAGGGLVMVAVTADSAYAGFPHTEAYTPEGNWLRHPVVNHDYPVDYQFEPPYPAYAFPLEFGKSWSMRVNATNPATGRARVMRVDGQVLGGERVSTPAGTFDTIKIVRTVYAGDAETFLSQTVVTEIDWYAPTLGRAVRIERRSRWSDVGRTTRGMGGDWVRGDWSVYELVAYAPAIK
jgi:hypothetical protein